MEGISILLVDDHQIIREGLKEYLKETNQFHVVEESTNGKEALNWLEKNNVDVVVTDISMPVMDGIEFTRQCKINNTDQKVLALTMLNDSRSIKKMISSGVNGYILKTCSKGEFIHSLEEVAHGKSIYGRKVTETIMDTLVGKKTKKMSSEYEIPLSVREKQVLRLVCEEKSNQVIAEELFISVRTVESHKRNILEKTGSRNVAGLVIYALENGLID